MSQSSSTPKEPVLGDGTKGTYAFAQWRVLARARLQQKKCMPALLDAESEDGKACDADCKSNLVTMAGKFALHVDRCKTALEAWKLLEQHFMSQSPARYDTLEEKYRLLTRRPDQSISDIFNEGVEIYHDLDAMDYWPDRKSEIYTREPVYRICKAFKGLEWTQARLSMYSTLGQYPSVLAAQRYLEEFEAELIANEKLKGAKTLAAAHMSGGAGGGGGVGSRSGLGGAGGSGGGGGQRGAGQRPRPDIQCWKCEEFGHFSNRCNNRHLWAAVEAKKKRAGGGGGGAWGGNRGGGQQQQAAPQQQLQQQQGPAGGDGDRNRRERFRMFAAVQPDPLHPGPSSWIADSGSFYHLTYDLADLYDLRPLPEPVSVQFGTGNVCTATQHGRMVLVTSVSGMERELEFDSVLFMPGARVKALSIMLLDKRAGLRSTFGNGQLVCSTRDGREVMLGRECEAQGVYVVEAYTLQLGGGGVAGLAAAVRLPLA